MSERTAADFRPSFRSDPFSYLYQRVSDGKHEYDLENHCRYDRLAERTIYEQRAGHALSLDKATA